MVLMWDLLKSILLALFVLLALVGLWHLAAVYGCGYKVLPMYQRSACGSQVHQLAYITEHERHQLMAAGGSGKAQPGTQGVPCYPVHPSTPPPSPSAKRPKRSDETPTIRDKTKKKKAKFGFLRWNDIDDAATHLRREEEDHFMNLDKEFRQTGRDQAPGGGNAIYEDGSQWMAHEPYIQQHPLPA